MCVCSQMPVCYDLLVKLTGFIGSPTGSLLSPRRGHPWILSRAIPSVSSIVGFIQSARTLLVSRKFPAATCSHSHVIQSTSKIGWFWRTTFKILSSSKLR